MKGRYDRYGRSDMPTHVLDAERHRNKLVEQEEFSDGKEITQREQEQVESMQLQGKEESLCDKLMAARTNA